MIKKSAIVDKATVDAQDARVKKMMKLETWFSEGSLRVEQQQTASVQLFNSVLDCKRLVFNTIGGVPLGVAMATGFGD